MKLLVFSDSHAALFFMRRCIRAIKPDAIIHLGDHFDDGAAMAEENPHILVHQVPGNCDSYRMLTYKPEMLCYPIAGVQVYMTHGHKHMVKTTLVRLLHDARSKNASIVLYGHTHQPDCHVEDDGLWVMNPGSCGYGGGTAGLIELKEGKILNCKIISQMDLEEL